MGKDSSISWTDHTFSPWWGCTKISAGCEHCYADSFSRRVGHGKRLPTIWGPRAERRFMSDAHWKEPLRWNRAAEKAGKRARVFCASMADVFEDREDLRAPRARLWRLIAETTHLDWLLLTKRPENAERLALQAWSNAFAYSTSGGEPERWWLPNIWLGTTCENQARADERIPHLLEVPAAVRFVSYEPALGPVDFERWLPKPCPRCGRATDAVDCDQCAGMGLVDLRPSLDWIIIGGESGPGARPFDLAWMRSVVRQCREAKVAAFCKQLGAKPYDSSIAVDVDAATMRATTGNTLGLRDPKGGNIEEWPEGDWPREFPRGAS